MEYVRATTTDDLLSNLQRDGAHIICGGTDILVKMRHGMASPSVLIDICDLAELREIRVIGQEVHVGAAATESMLLRTEAISDHLPLLARVLRSLGAEQIRTRGTLGGNLANASPAADSAIPLLLYDARLRLVGATQERWVPIGEYFLGPGTTVLSPGEFIHTIAIPVQSPEWKSFYHKVGRRQALIISIASLGVLIHCDEDIVRQVRIAAGSVAPTPIRLRSAEKILLEGPLTDARIRDAVKVAARSVSPIDDIRATANYRRQVVGDLLERFLQQALHQEV